MKEKFVKKGWYRVTIPSGRGHRTFVGQLVGGGPSKILKGKMSYVFDIGHDETRTHTGPATMWISEDDVISAKRLSPRYIETKITKRGGKTIERYDSPDIAYGED